MSSKLHLIICSEISLEDKIRITLKVQYVKMMESSVPLLFFKKLSFLGPVHLGRDNLLFTHKHDIKATSLTTQGLVNLNQTDQALSHMRHNLTWFLGTVN